MIDEFVARLQDPDPAVRQRAIRALARSKDVAALKPLAAIVRGDPDPALRDLARKAGQYIRRSTQPPEPPKPSEPEIVPPFIGYDLPDEPEPEDLVPMGQTPVHPGEPSTPQFRHYKMLDQAALDLEGEEASDDAAQDQSGQVSPGLVPVKGRQYNVSKSDQDRAKQYIDAALSLNISGDNARAMKNLTEALAMNPNLINDSYFNNVAAAITGFDGDAAAQMIIDRNQRRRFVNEAEHEQKSRRVEAHMNEALQSTWTDFWFELILFALIVIIGPVLAMLVTAESATNLIKNFAQVSGELPAQIKSAQAIFSGMSAASLLPIGIISGLSGVVSLVIQTALIHVLAKAMGGTGTWRHLIRVLLGFYNKWLPIIFLVAYITIAVTFISLFSPIVLCFVLALVILTLYVSGKTSGKIGEAYDFGGAKGCMTLVFSSLLILLFNVVISYLLARALGVAFTQVLSGQL